MSIVWNDDMVYELIELYKTKTILWDSENKHFKNRVKKNNAWEDISKIMGISQKDVECKMHTLRSQFAREKKKYLAAKAAGLGFAESEKSKWKFFSALKFLISETTTVIDVDCPNKTVLIKEEYIVETERWSPELTVISTPPPAITFPLQPLPPSPTNIPTNQNSEKRKQEDLDEILELVRAKKKLEENPKDEYDFYGQYVASELRAAKNENAVLRAKSYINEILINMRMGKYDGRQLKYERSPTPSSEEC